MPSALLDAEFGPWSGAPLSDISVTLPSNYVISNCESTCKLFQITAPALDEVYVNLRKTTCLSFYLNLIAPSYRPRTHRTKSLIVNLVAKTHVNLMAFYTGLPSCVRLPISYSQPALPHVYQLQ
jgi:hypothetical protein